MGRAYRASAEPHGRRPDTLNRSTSGPVGPYLEAAALHGYPVVLERSRTGFGAYAPDLPGCVATGATAAATLERMAGAIALHLQGMREDGEPVPEPSAGVAIVGPAS